MMDYSLGSYFNKFSEDIQDISKIVAMKSPNKRCTSVTMNSDRDEDVTSSLSESETNRNPAIAGNINSTSQDTTISNAEALLPVHPPNEQESKDSGNASEVSYRESVCVFEQALRKTNQFHIFFFSKYFLLYMVVQWIHICLLL